ncbi:unnamed protein product [Linum trigynum]|uniref:Uncharacterized protein n=1 Tax=Linum trigynum TaxID=586398 RepID=A0AAV2EJ33_9ROSI
MQLSLQRWFGSGASCQTICRSLMKLPSRSSAVIFSVLFLLGGALISTRLLDSNAFSGSAREPEPGKVLTASRITLPGAAINFSSGEK